MIREVPSTSAWARLAGFLAAVRRRLQRRDREELAAMAVGGGAGGLLLLAIVGQLVGPSRGLSIVSGVAAVAGVVLWARAARLRRRALAPDAAVARHVAQVAPALGDELYSAVELRDAGSGGGSRELVEALAERVADATARWRATSLVDLGPARRRAALRLAAVAAAWALALFVYPGVRGLRAGLAALVGRVPEAHFSTSREPIVGDVRLVLTPPAYTGLAPRAIEGTSGQLLALPGTEVRIEARALQRARRARLVITEEGGRSVTREATLDGEGRLGGELTVGKVRGTWRFALDDTQEPEPHRIEIEADRPPRVDLFAPAETLEVERGRKVQIGWSVDDDYGLGPIELVWTIEGGKGDAPAGPPDGGAGDATSGRRVVATPEAGARASQGTEEWDLDEIARLLAARPGARVSYHLEAKDNDAVSGPKVGVSRSFTLGVRDEQAERDRALQLEERLLEQAVATLADRLELDPGDDGKLRAVHAAERALAQAAALVAKALSDDKRAQAAKKELDAIAARLERLVRDEERILGQREAARREHPRHVAELERDTLLIDDLLGRQRLEELLRIGDEMTATRDRLKKLLAEYKKTGDPALKRKIAEELAELERKLAELAQKAQHLAGEVPDQFLNPAAMGKNDAKDAMAKIREMLDKGDVDKAMAELERLSSQLDGMMSSMEGDLQGFRSERFSEEERQLAELEDQLAELAHDEEEIRKEAAELQQRAQKGRSDEEAKLEPHLKRLRKQAEELKRQVGEVDPRSMPSWDQDDIAKAKQRANDIDRNLGAGDIAEARSLARRTADQLDALANDARDALERGARGFQKIDRPGLERARQQLKEGLKTARELAADLERLAPRSPQVASAPEDQKRMQDLAERQRATRRRAQEVARKLEQMRRNAGQPEQSTPEGSAPNANPMMSAPEAPGRAGQEGQGQPGEASRPLMRALRDAEDHMGRAESQMRQSDADNAESEAREALDRLSEAKRQLRNERRPRNEGAGARQATKEPVRIPGAEEWKPPKEFRQDILDAMKRGAPRGWEEQVKRYYEELVK
jgi:hypothetical protein